MFNRVNMRVKICGITQADQAIEIAQLGATDLGFICVQQSPRYVDPAALATLIQTLKTKLHKVPDLVGVFANHHPNEVCAIVRQTGLSAIQLHGQESLAECQQLRGMLPNVAIVKAIRVRDTQALELAHTYTSLVDALLLDAYHPQQLGGTGRTLNWQALETFRPQCHWLLAGGLNPSNIQTALNTIQPDGIDLSSGVEEQPGVKDMALVKQLFEKLQPWLVEERQKAKNKK
jgi:phosphoribosylanthranilate isomerase